MHDRRIADKLAGLADPVQPDPEFREFLYRRLISEVDFDRSRRPADDEDEPRLDDRESPKRPAED